MAAMDDLSIFHKIRKYRVCISHVVLCSILVIFMTYLTVTISRDNLSHPTLYIQDLYVPALNKTTAFNTSVFVNLKLERAKVYDYCPSYTDFQINLYYGSHRGMPVAHHVVEGFVLGRRTELVVKAAMEAPTLPWEEASSAVSSGSKVVLMVELMVTQGPDICNLRPPTDMGLRMKVHAAYVAVDASGHMVSKRPIEFKFMGSLSY